LDFCEKYKLPARQKESLPEFLRKLQEKRQTKAQQEQAASVIKAVMSLRSSFALEDQISLKAIL
jgi:hypothetical protein